MGPNRSDVIKADEPGIYHLTTRCIRKLFLYRSKKGNKHFKRRKYILDRIKRLASLFGISIGFKAVLENHLHLVVMTHPDLVKEWTDEEVLRRVCKIFPYKFRMLGVKDCEPTASQIARFSADAELMAEMRERLSSPSWLMRQLLHPLAVMVNREDEQEGHVVDRRFRAFPILDEPGLLICGLYVDLNEVRARLAASLEEAMHSSVGHRIMACLLRRSRRNAEADEYDGHLRPINLHGDAPSALSRRATDKGMFEMTQDQYLKLLDAVGRIDRTGKKGKIAAEAAPVLEQLNFTLDALHTFITRYEELFRGCVGSAKSMADYEEENGRRVGDIDAIRELESRGLADGSDRPVRGGVRRKK